jgi:hypothetical protein
VLVPEQPHARLAPLVLFLSERGDRTPASQGGDEQSEFYLYKGVHWENPKKETADKKVGFRTLGRAEKKGLTRAPPP